MDQILDRPIECFLPLYPCRFRVLGFERRRNAGPMLTLAIAEFKREGFSSWKPHRDIATEMKLADLCSAYHDLPVNADWLYGPAGRGCEVGRKEGRSEKRHFNEAECGGTFDGFNVTSDADPGL